MRVLYPARIGMGDVGICGGRKAGEAGEKPAEQGEQETQPTYGTGPDSNPGARFSKLPVITGPVKLFCFPFQMGVSKLLQIIQ